MSNWATNVQICPGDLVKMEPVMPEFSSKIPLHKIVVDEHGNFMIDWSTHGVCCRIAPGTVCLCIGVTQQFYCVIDPTTLQSGWRIKLSDVTVLNRVVLV